MSPLCDVLGVSRSGYYYWQAHRQPTARRVHLPVQARPAEASQTFRHAACRRHRGCQGLDVGRHQARSLMREAGAAAVCPKKRHAYPAGETSRVADNVLNREFDAAKPDQKWVGDTAYLWTAAGWVCLAVVPGLFSRKVVGWCLSDAPDTRLVLAAPGQAATLRRITPDSGLLFQLCQHTRRPAGGAGHPGE